MAKFKIESGGISLRWGEADTFAPEGIIEGSEPPRIVVAVSTPDPRLRVFVKMKVGAARERTFALRPERLTRTEQFFEGTFQEVRAGDRVSYSVYAELQRRDKTLRVDSSQAASGIRHFELVGDTARRRPAAEVAPVEPDAGIAVRSSTPDVTRAGVSPAELVGDTARRRPAAEVVPAEPGADIAVRSSTPDVIRTSVSPAEFARSRYIGGPPPATEWAPGSANLTLAMIALGITDDQPMNALQPALIDGVHLRWGFSHGLDGKPGFPWHGFYLFRRPMRGQDTLCLRGDDLQEAEPLSTDPPWVDRRFNLPEPARRVTVRVVAQEQSARIALMAGAMPVKIVELTSPPFVPVEAVFDCGLADAVGVDGNIRRVVEICSTPIRWGLKAGWHLVPDCRVPIGLPVAAPDYPLTQPSIADAEAVALDRIRYGVAPAWGSASFADLHPAMVDLVRDGPARPMADPARATVYPAEPDPANPAAPQPRMPALHPLDMLLAAALYPPVAEIIGLAFVDRHVQRGEVWDYLLVADRSGTFAAGFGTLNETLAAAIDGTLDGVEICTALGVIVDRKPPLSPPSDARAYALPGGTVRTQAGPRRDLSCNTGLRWADDRAGLGKLQADAPVLFHLWRAGLGEVTPAAPPPAAAFQPITTTPVMRARAVIATGSPQRPPGWPIYRMHIIDSGLAKGWYSYAVSSIDIFGRHSPLGPPARWFDPDQTVTNPAAWAFVPPPGEILLHPFAIHQLDTIPPPPPTGVEATLLDPADPWVFADAAYQAWRAAHPTTLGLRVRWRWTAEAAIQAPDTREFRVYFKRDRFNALPVTVAAVATATATESLATLADPDAMPVDAYVGGVLLVGQEPWEILGSQGGTALVLRVRNRGIAGDRAPPSRVRASIVLPAGQKRFIDPRIATSWDERVYALVDTPSDARDYEVFLDAPANFLTTLAEPMRLGAVGVSAADDCPDTADNVKWSASPLGNRPGNESIVSVPAIIVRVHRDRPPPPTMPPDSERIYASPANWQGWSYYTFRWIPAADLATHVFRALDEALFAVDRTRRPRPPISPTDTTLFPPEPRWDLLKRQTVADELNALNAAVAAGADAARAAYGSLSNDGMRVLAGLPGNERAFLQVTITAIEADDPAAANRLGPDNPVGFPIDPALQAFIDRLDGRAGNRYFYRAGHVDRAHNRGPLGLSSPPIWLPPTVAPRAPIIVSVRGGERRVTLRISAQPALAGGAYRFFRTEDTAASRDVRLMTEIATIPTAPTGTEWTDKPVVALRSLYYRVVALDAAGNSSAPSEPIEARAFDEALPVAPPLAVHWLAGTDPVARAVWTAVEQTRLEVRPVTFPTWGPASDWLASGSHSIDTLLSPATPWLFRLRVRKATGALTIGPYVGLQRRPG